VSATQNNAGGKTALAVEQPVEIRVDGRPITVTMRATFGALLPSSSSYV
jgi:formate dehydrogenase assembly factor FdhD